MTSVQTFYCTVQHIYFVTNMILYLVPSRQKGVESYSEALCTTPTCFVLLTQFTRIPLFRDIDVLLRPRQHPHMIPLASPRSVVLDHTLFELVAKKC